MSYWLENSFEFIHQQHDYFTRLPLKRKDHHVY